MTAGELDALWGTNPLGPVGWYHRAATPEQKEWVQAIAAHISVRGTNPTWAQVHRVFCEKWPDSHHPVASTLRDAVLDLVE